MSIFFSYVLLGLALSIPLGPVIIAQMEKGIKNGFFSSWLVGLGAMSGDILFMALIYLGVSQFVNTPFMQTLLWLFGFFVLVYTGIESLMTTNEISIKESRSSDTPLKSYLFGFLISISNPVSILFWLGIYGSILAKTAASHGTYETLLYSSGIFVGLFLFDLSTAILSSSFRHILTDRLLKTLSNCAGLTLIGFGAYFGLQAAKVLFQ